MAEEITIHPADVRDLTNRLRRLDVPVIDTLETWVQHVGLDALDDTILTVISERKFADYLIGGQ